MTTSPDPLVLLHGAGMSARAWRPLLPLMTPHHRVVVPTLSGHRAGPAWPDGTGFTVDALVDAVEAQLDGAGVGSAHVVGNSLGGWAALELARRGRALSVVALSPAGVWRADRDMRRLVTRFRLARRAARSPWTQRATARSSTRRLLLRLALQHGDRLTAAEAGELVIDFADAPVLPLLLDGAATHPRLQCLPESCPVRVAWGEKDRVLPWRRWGEPLRHVVPGAEFVMLPGVGHVPMWDDPELVARTVLEVTGGAAGVRPAVAWSSVPIR